MGDLISLVPQENINPTGQENHYHNFWDKFEAIFIKYWLGPYLGFLECDPELH